ncbi:hypothetical protein HAT2_00459 [Candidatus Similichlamydia laticola]|uniref:Uncharacterized protein n=1 Tax=Candidatus Similichlamydia laticola TaxID=2170265 RepID=A0A369KKB0_9BACT|nr:hypothetical protein HAT2_00459 [Candidatus Similichlamydia laticola]
MLETKHGQKVTGFAEGTWGFNSRYRYFEPVRLLTTAGLSFVQTWKSLTLDLSLGGCYRSAKDARTEDYLSFKTLEPGHMLFCSQEFTCTVGPDRSIGGNLGAYWKAPDFVNKVQVNSKQILGRGEIFYTWTPSSSLSLRFCYARSTQTRGFGTLGFKCAVRK